MVLFVPDELFNVYRHSRSLKPSSLDSGDFAGRYPAFHFEEDTLE